MADANLIEPLNEGEIAAARTALGSLTPRERQVVRAMGNGMTAAETATALNIAQKTVDLHRANIFRKLSAGGALDVIRVAAAVRLSMVALLNANIDWTPALHLIT